MKTKFAVWCIAFGVLFGNVAIAQTPLTRDQLIAAGVDADRYLAAQSASQNSPPPAWGTSSDSALVLPASAFTPRLGLALWGGFGTGERFRTSQTIGGTVVVTDSFFDAPVNLPEGAKITGLRVNTCDTNAGTSHIIVWLEKNDEPLGTAFAIYGQMTTTNTGCTSMFADLTSNNLPPFDHATKTYWVRFQLTATDSTNMIRSAVVYYRLQVSTPAPGTQTFADVPPTHPLYKFVEALYAAGITAGCANGNFCPDATVTRGQMAVFLSAALGLHWPN